jgi:hypothetical protein
MSRTEHRVLHLFRAGLAGAAGVVLLAACSGNGGGSTGDALAANSAAETSDAPSPAGAGNEAFCDRAAGIDDRVDAALAGLDEGASVPDAFSQIAVELRAIEPPAAIATAWTDLGDGLDEIATAVADLDLTDLDSLEALDDIGTRLTDAGDQVDAYLSEECGIGG